MSNINWNKDNISDLGRKFLRKVRDNMRNRDESSVEFGETGLKRIQPNYQTTWPNKKTHIWRGSSHQEFEIKNELENKDEFDKTKLSMPFSLKDIDDAIAKATKY